MSTRSPGDRRPVADADVCIVGSGPAGALVADALAARGRRVTVLDAGERYSPRDRSRWAELWLRPDFDHNDFWLDDDRDAYSSSGEIFARLNDVRVKGVGGSSLLWNGNTPRLHERDFESVERDGTGVDWPIGYDDLRPYYAAAEREMGVSGEDDNPHGPPREEPFPMPGFPRSYSDRLFAEACDALGISMATQPKAIASEADGDRPACDGYGVCNACPVGAKYTAEQHVHRAEERGATVIDRAQVLELEHDERGERVTAAVYATPDGKTHRQEATTFVLAAGGIETPRLLLLSDSDVYPDGMANTSGAVGRYLMDHSEIEVHAVLEDEHTWQNNIGFVSSRSDQFYTPDEGVPGSFALVFHNTAGPTAGGFMQSKTAVQQLRTLAGNPDAETFEETVSDPFNSVRLGDDLFDDVDSAGTHGVGIRAVSEVLPRAENRVTLDESTTDNHGRPVPDVSLQYGDHERETLDYAEEVVRDVMDELGAEVTSVVDIDDSKLMGSHHIGTTRMGSDPQSSVVDADCRTHDLDNLWVASSSVFPTSGAVNPTLTIGALSLRVAEHVDSVLTG
ncbi:GMC family oxidoreductase [Halogeometricum limi]|uniref:Choline dehydrogenase n=1 Tax=Halogeometricum limi TaxID=555875 RepID=A0A1I6I5B7_9EURY|nr:GMC family oxidoreductase [Halogeometricum limi]SFR61912.1 Choline dehydrogenase [Halogeometricum limi]